MAFQQQRPNEPNVLNPAMASPLQFGHPWRRGSGLLFRRQPIRFMHLLLRRPVFLSLLLCCCVLSDASFAEPSAQHWIPTLGIIAVPKQATAPHRAAAARLAKAFGGNVITVDGRNPVCCVWLDIGLPVPNPGTPGYIVLHQRGGTTISASGQEQLDRAVTRLIAVSKIVDSIRVLPEGVITSFPVFVQ